MSNSVTNATTYKIAFLAGSLYSQASGIKVVAESLSRELVLLGHDVCVFGQASNAQNDTTTKNWIGSSAKSFVSSFPSSFGYSKDLYKALLAFNPDIVHIHGIWTYASIAGMQLKKTTGATLIQSPHGMLSKAAITQSKLKKKLAMVFFQSKCLSYVDGFHVTAQSEALELDSIQCHTNKVAIIHNGIDLISHPLPYFKNRKNRILALCRLEPKKGLPKLLKAWSSIENRYSDWILEIRGPDRHNHRSKLQRDIRKLGIKNVILGSGAYGTERNELIATSKLFVLPSENENFGMTVAEALSLRTPVIASTGAPWSGLHDQECGWWTDNDTTALAKTLNIAINTSDEELEEMGVRGHNWMQSDFQWSDIARNMTEFYQNCETRVTTSLLKVE